jgi:nucleoside-diphosphate-sugar epimerase
MRVLAEERPDVVVHQLTDLKEQSSAANARMRNEGTRNLVDAAKAASVERIIAQSIAWAYAPRSSFATEDTMLDIGAEPPRKITIDGVLA